MLIRPIDTLPTRASTPARMVLAVISALFLILAAGSMLAPAQADQGGNSANAKACQKDGYKTLYSGTGGTFFIPGQCTSYAAHGGTLSSSRYPQANTQCKSFGGTLTDAPAGAFGYRCDLVPGSPGVSAAYAAFFTDVHPTCLASGGTSSYGQFGLSAPLQSYYVCSRYEPSTT